MTSLGCRFVREEEGQDIIEYALLAALVSVVAYALIVIIGQDAIVYQDAIIYTGTLATTSAAGSRYLV